MREKIFQLKMFALKSGMGELVQISEFWNYVEEKSMVTIKKEHRTRMLWIEMSDLSSVLKLGTFITGLKLLESLRIVYVLTSLVNMLGLSMARAASRTRLRGRDNSVSRFQFKLGWCCSVFVRPVAKSK